MTFDVLFIYRYFEIVLFCSPCECGPVFRIVLNAIRHILVRILHSYRQRAASKKNVGRDRGLQTDDLIGINNFLLIDTVKLFYFVLLSNRIVLNAIRRTLSPFFTHWSPGGQGQRKTWNVTEGCKLKTLLALTTICSDESTAMFCYALLKTGKDRAELSMKACAVALFMWPYE